tara:strand:+ start:590 stop:901 length:312 start_codon:yes stop_codon:yes gene_type:complete
MAEDKKFVWSKEHPEGVLEDLTEEEKKQRQKDKSEMLSEFEKALLSLRETRNFLLLETDWTAGSDLTMSAEMKTYRQQLRDATSGLDTVEKINAYTFPTKVEK